MHKILSIFDRTHCGFVKRGKPLVLKLAWYIIILYLFIRDRLQTVEYYSDSLLYF